MPNTVNINIDKTSMGLDQVNNTSDLNKPISTATQTALNGKEDVSNKSTNTSLGTSDTLYPTQNAVKVYTDNLLGSANALVYKGTIDCSTNPNYPSANAGELYIVSVAGKIGGASGVNVEAGDMLICNTDGTISGNQSTVGSYWNAIQKNIDGSVTGGSSSVNNNLVVFDGTTGKVIKDSGIAINSTSNYITKKDLTGNIVNSLLYDNGTNVGLGVTNPISKLHISTVDKTINTLLISTEHITLTHESNSTGYNTIVASNSSQGHRGVYKSTRSRGTLDIPLAVNNGDLTLTLLGAAYDGTTMLNTAGITYYVDNIVTTGSVPQAISFATGTSTRIERLRIESNGNIVASANITATNLSGTNTGNETTSTIGSLINGSASATPNDTDLVATAESSVLKKITWTNVKAFLKTYFDTIYTTTSAVSTQISTALVGYATQTWVNSQGFITNVVTALGYTPENSANKQTDLTASATKYPTVNAVNAGLDTKSDKNITLNRQTASYTLVAGDNGKLIEMNVATANTLTINTSIFSAGNQFLVSQYGAGQTTITAGAGVTLRSNGAKLKTSGQYALVTIIAISSTEFYIAGDLTA